MQKFLFIILAMIFSSPFCIAVPVNPNDNFNSTTLDTSLWSVSYDTTYGPYYTYSLDGNYFISSGYNCGGTQLKTNYYLIGDFDAVIDVKFNNNTAPYQYITFRFIKYDSNPYPNSSSHGTDWGFAGSAYGWFPNNNWWYYGDGGVDANLGYSNWYQLRLQRVGNNAYAYYRTLGATSWTLQQSYLNFGTTAVYLTHTSGEGNNGQSPSSFADNFLVTGYADTDPNANPVPEPSVFLCFLLGILIKAINQML